ncbi:MAG TPA: hypothetical protein VHY91_10625 [Pirellulales bacterium]|nr:hypothetical protein [Pirellulales bacterium]
MKPFTIIAIVVFALVALLHIARLVFGWEVVVGGMVLPMWGSVVAAVVVAAIALMLWRENQPGRHGRMGT